MILYIDDFEILWMVGFIIVDFRKSINVGKYRYYESKYYNRLIKYFFWVMRM